jgi:hypothetical protein
MTHPSVEKLTEAASGLTEDSTAIWLVICMNESFHVAKMTNQLMSHGGQA